MREIIFLNGKFIEKEQARLSILQPGFLYGWGLFETMRSYNNKILYLNQHLERIKNSSRLIKIRLPYSLTKLKMLIKETVKLGAFKDAHVRLTLWKSESRTDVLIVARNYKPYPEQKYKQGFSARVSEFRQNENSFLARIKTTSYLLYRLAYLEAKKRRFDEAIILNNSGHLAEGSRTNLFLAKNNTLFTPALECGCLDGITRRLILDLARKHNIKVNEGNFTLQDLYNTEGAFLTNSLMGVMPLTSVEEYRIAKGKMDSLTKFFMQEYHSLLKNGA